MQRRGRTDRRTKPYSRGGGEEDWKKGMYQKKSISIKGRANTVFVSNLNTELTEEDITEIFHQIGFKDDVKEVALNYNSKGKSQGTASVTFRTSTSAAECVEEYDGAEVDGKEMQLKLIGGAPAAATQPTVRRAAERNSRAGFGEALTDEFVRGTRKSYNDYDDEREGSRGFLRRGFGETGGGRYRRGGGGRGGGGRGRYGGGRGGGGGRGRNGGGRGGGRNGRRNEKPATAEDLDAEMDAYFGKKTEKATKKGGKGGRRGKDPEPVKEDLDAEMDNYFKGKGGGEKEVEAPAAEA